MVQSMEVFEWEKTAGPKRREDFIQKTYEKTQVEKTLVKVAGSPNNLTVDANNLTVDANNLTVDEDHRFIGWFIGFSRRNLKNCKDFFELRYIIRKN